MTSFLIIHELIYYNDELIIHKTYLKDAQCYLNDVSIIETH